MKRSFQLLAAAVFVVAAFFFSTAAQAQDAPPAGGFKNAYLSLNKSGKVVLTYTLWKDQVGKGKNTLVFFWASWSEESREEASRVQALYQKYAGKVDVLGVTYNDEISDSMDAMAEWGIKFPQIVDVEDQIAERFDFDTVPYVVLLGPDGKPVASGLHGDQIAAVVAGL